MKLLENRFVWSSADMMLAGGPVAGLSMQKMSYFSPEWKGVVTSSINQANAEP